MMIEMRDILLELEMLKDMIEGFGNTDLNEAKKKALSHRLAELSMMIRAKYELTSAFFLPAEMKAERKVQLITTSKDYSERLKHMIMED